MGTKGKLLLLKLKGRVTWGHRSAWASVPVPRPLVAQGARGQQRPLEVPSPSPHLRNVAWAWERGGIHLHFHRPRDSTGTTPGLTPPPKAPQTGHRWPPVLPRVSLLPRPQPLNSTELLSNRYR